MFISYHIVLLFGNGKNNFACRSKCHAPRVCFLSAQLFSDVVVKVRDTSTSEYFPTRSTESKMAASERKSDYSARWIATDQIDGVLEFLKAVK